MSDITKDDLRTPIYREALCADTRRVTDEEFDRIAREQGYVKPDDRMSWSDWWGRFVQQHSAKALRALLTDKCPACKGTGQFPTDGVPCTVCDGRGWLPKDGTVKTHGGLHLSFPADWLEAEHE